ncbi:hypothetical protein U0070_006222, partial [Myodes glareolus]
AKALALSARTASPPPPSFRPRPRNRAGESLGGARSSAWPHPPVPAFSRAAASHWALAAPARLLGCAQLQPDSSPTPARLQPCSSSAPALLQPCSSLAPVLRRHASLVPHPRDLAPSQDPVPDLLPPSTPPQSSALSLAPHLPGRQSVCLSASPPSFSFLCPASLVCSLVRLGGAASQENPRNHCKKLTMKFKKFYDFGAIFEWSESTKLDVGKVWLEGAEDVYTVRFGCGDARHLQKTDVLNCEERKRRSLWLLNHLAKHVAVLKGVPQCDPHPRWLRRDAAAIHVLEYCQGSKHEALHHPFAGKVEGGGQQSRLLKAPKQ